MNYMDVKTAAAKWGLTERRVTTLCRDQRIEGAKKEGGLWLIPTDAGRPDDRRRNKVSERTEQPLLPLPIGVSDYKELVSGYYYVDKTLMIKEFLDSRPKVSLFTRPRRFGKTLTMDMFKTFFEISDTDTSVYFSDKKIWSCGDTYRKEQGQYPVIFVTFKDIKYTTWEQAYEAIRDVIANEYRRHSYLLDSPKCTEYDKKYFTDVLNGDATEVGLSRAFAMLSFMLNLHHGKNSIIIIDEYDTPIQQAYVADYYTEIVGFMRNLFSGAFKDNKYLAYGFLTGILRVAKESIFSGLNNLTIHSVLDSKYSEYFGFTAEEVRALTEYYGASDRYTDICEWYDGYLFGDRDIFNPWSVINYFYNNCFPKAYWQSTGDNSIIRQIVSEADNETAENLRRLMQGQTVSTYVDTSVIYPEIQSNPTTIYSFLLAAGYLKVVKKDALHDGNSICDVSIPNKEIFYVYEKEILSALSDILPQSTAIGIQQAILRRNVPELRAHLATMLKQTISSFDYAREVFYHGLLLGICAVMNNLYRVDSNKESGYGRYDISLTPYDQTMHGIIIELKVIKESVAEDRIEEELALAAKGALEQIDSRRYLTDMKREGITKFLKLGVSFHKKYVHVEQAEESVGL